MFKTKAKNKIIRKADTTTSSLFTITYYFQSPKGILVKSEE